MMSIMIGSLSGHDGVFERGEKGVLGLVLVGGSELGEILSSKRDEPVRVDPHAMGQPFDPAPLFLAQGNQVHQRPQRLGDEGGEFAHLDPINADQEPIIGNGERVEAERSEEHTSELQSLMRISYAVFCLKKKKKQEQIKERYKNK